MTSRFPARIVTIVAIVLVTIASISAVALGLHLEPNVASLLPERGASAALRRYVRGFGGGDLAVVMVAGEDPDENARAADEIACGLKALPSVKQATAHAEISRVLEPMLAFRYADAAGQARLAAVLTPEG